MMDIVTSAVIDTGRLKRVGDQAGDPSGQYRPGQGDPICRVDGRLVTVRAGDGEQRGRRGTGSQPGDPARDGETGRGRHDAEQGGCGENPQGRRTQNRRQRVFVRRRCRTQRVFVRRLCRTQRVFVRWLSRTQRVFVRRPDRTHRASVRNPWRRSQREERVGSHAGSPRPADCQRCYRWQSAEPLRLNYASSRPV